MFSTPPSGSMPWVAAFYTAPTPAAPCLSPSHAASNGAAMPAVPCRVRVPLAACEGPGKGRDTVYAFNEVLPKVLRRLTWRPTDAGKCMKPRRHRPRRRTRPPDCGRRPAPCRKLLLPPQVTLTSRNTKRGRGFLRLSWRLPRPEACGADEGRPREPPLPFRYS